MDPPLVEAPVKVRLLARSGRWHPWKAPVPARLRIGREFALVIGQPDFLNALLGGEWAFSAAKGSIDRYEERFRDVRNLRRVQRNLGIVLSAPTSAQTIAILPPKDRVEECWNALVAAGFRVAEGTGYRVTKWTSP